MDLLTEASQRLSPEAMANLRQWPADAEVRALAEAGQWPELEDSFYKRLNIGTGGIRGRIGPGPNRINTRTIGEAAQALSTFIKARGPEAIEHGVVVGHEARKSSHEFATICCGVFAANGIPSFLFDGIRSTPEISFAVRHLKTTAGVQITASHNPRTDNGFKFYWSYGGQVVPPLDQEFMELVRGVREIDVLPYEQALAKGFVKLIGSEVDEAYFQAVLSLSLEQTRSARVVFSAMHGAATTNVLPVLRKAGFQVEPIAEQLEPDERFPTAVGDLINPEYREVVELPLQRTRASGADIAICSDPDADRAGVVAKLRPDAPDVELLRGDDVAAALTYYLLDRRSSRGLQSPNDIVLETFVTTSLVCEIARGFKVECVDDLLVGFKWMAQVIQAREDEGRLGFPFATEESIGYLAGNFVRDKDAAIAALLVAEMASWLKDRGQTIWQYLDEIYARFGCYRNLQHLVELPGKTGMQTMQEVMLGFRAKPPAQLGSLRVQRTIDRLGEESRSRDRYAIGKAEDIITFVLSEDGRTRVTLRPSGTEPKLKYYIQVFKPVVDGVQEVKLQANALARTLAEAIVESSGTVIGACPGCTAEGVLKAEWSGSIRRFV